MWMVDCGPLFSFLVWNLGDCRSATRFPVACISTLHAYGRLVGSRQPIPTGVAPLATSRPDPYPTFNGNELERAHKFLYFIHFDSKTTLHYVGVPPHCEALALVSRYVSVWYDQRTDGNSGRHAWRYCELSSVQETTVMQAK